MTQSYSQFFFSLWCDRLSSIILRQTGFLLVNDGGQTVCLLLYRYTCPHILSLSNQHSMQHVGSATDEIEKPRQPTVLLS